MAIRWAEGALQLRYKIYRGVAQRAEIVLGADALLLIHSVKMFSWRDCYMGYMGGFGLRVPSQEDFEWL